MSTANVGREYLGILVIAVKTLWRTGGTAPWSGETRIWELRRLQHYTTKRMRIMNSRAIAPQTYHNHVKASILVPILLGARKFRMAVQDRKPQSWPPSANLEILLQLPGPVSNPRAPSNLKIFYIQAKTSLTNYLTVTLCQKSHFHHQPTLWPKWESFGWLIWHLPACRQIYIAV